MLLALLCVAFSPQTRAACGSPDPGCAGGNLAEGAGALLSLTTGTYNTAIGYLSLRSNTEGGFNTGVGAGALLSNNSGRNTATGAAALLSNTTGPANTANGALALLSNTEGGYNTAVGDRALQVHTAGDRNTAIGASALLNDMTGTSNTAIGAAALLNNTTGYWNTAIGDDTLGANTTGDNNTAIGRAALFSNATGVHNTAMGSSALASNITGENNIALGSFAGRSTTGNSNIIIGHEGVVGESRTIRIGTQSFVPTRTFIAGIIDGPVTGTAVLVDASGELGVATSSARFKDQIKPMDKASEAVLELRPVRFHYKTDTKETPQFGLIAEDVEKVNRDLVVRDNEGKPYSVRYEQVNAMLLNEFLKEHKTVQELKKEIAALSATVKDQDSKIDRISDQLELSKPSPQLVDNNQ